MQYTRITFADVFTQAPEKPGLYEIYTLDGIPLKVGISINLRKRLIQHGESKQKYLLCTNGDWSNPNNVTSKRSILAKHLYFHQANGYDLTLENDRQRFLKNECYILFLATASREEARKLERQLETGGRFQFVGRAQGANTK